MLFIEAVFRLLFLKDPHQNIGFLFYREIFSILDSQEM